MPVVACFFSVSTPTVSVGIGGSIGFVTITATNPNCPYVVSSSTPFVTITSAATGTGSGKFTFTVATVNGPSRKATVNIGGAALTVTQAGTLYAPYNAGIFQPGGPTWALDSNGKGIFDAGTVCFPVPVNRVP